MAAAILVAAGTAASQAHLFNPEALQGALLGGLIGGLAGSPNSCGYHGGYYGGCGYSSSGAAIGAGVGLLAGALIGEANRQSYYASQPYYYTPQPYVQPGYGYVYAQAPAYSAPPRPNYAVGGTLLGAASGALIGYGNNRQTAEGAAIGAAAGLVVGGLAEAAAQKREQNWVSVQPPPPPPPAPPPPLLNGARLAIPPQPAANSPFPRQFARATPVCQIPDAARVPDAPTF